MQTFSFATAKTILNEIGGSRRLGEICRDHGAETILLVTDPGIRKAGLLNPVVASIQRANLGLEIFDRVEADPPEQTVLAAVAQARASKVDLVVGFGGGSSMDVAKLVALLASPHCRQSLTDVYGVGNCTGHRLPLIQVPTTAGTGSEVTPIAIVTTGATTKSGVVSPLLLPDMALLDAELTLGLPAPVTAATGIDAMVHAIEAYTSKLRKNPLSDLLAKEALRLLSGSIREAVAQGTDLEARSNMLLGAMLAGQAFANAPVAAVHALAYPLGGHFHIPHGLSNALVLCHVLRFNADTAFEQYAELAPILLGETCQGLNSTARCDRFIASLEQLGVDLGLPTHLREQEIPENFLERLAADAMLQQRLLINNPKPLSEADALAIYRAAF